MNASGQRLWVARGLIGLMCLVLVGLAGRLVYIQAVMGEALDAWSYRRQHSTIPVPARRGAILDRRHRVLAASRDQSTVYADPRLIEDRAQAAREVGRALAMPADEVLRRLEHPPSPGYVVLKRAVSDEEAQAVQELAADGLTGIGSHLEPAREYPMGQLAAHVLGFVGADGRGLEGIELTCDGYLRARSGRRVVYRDVERRAMFQQAGSYVAPQDGVHVVLTLDAAIQEVVERELAAAVQHYQAESGVGLVMDPYTGEMLAMANYPTFSPANAGNVDAEVRRNRIVTDPVEPGSIFKPYIMVAALMDRLVRPEDTIFCEDGLYVIGKRMLHDHHPYGTLTVEKVMVKSSNIGMAKLGQRLGNRRMHEVLHAFGFGEPTGIDLPGESPGLLMPLEKWNSYSTTSVPMGQELAVTPIQIATAFSALVNGGRRIQPKVVRAIVDEGGKVIEDDREPIVRGQAVDPEAARTMAGILVKVVNEGTGRRCQLERWQVLGKTGTAQVPWRHRRGYEPNAFLASFVAAAPAREPAAVALVMVRKPLRRIGHYGGTVSAPVVKAILDETLSYLQVPPDQPRPDERQLAWDGLD